MNINITLTIPDKELELLKKAGFTPTNNPFIFVRDRVFRSSHHEMIIFNPFIKEEGVLHKFKFAPEKINSEIWDVEVGVRLFDKNKRWFDGGSFNSVSEALEYIEE